MKNPASPSEPERRAGAFVVPESLPERVETLSLGNLERLNALTLRIDRLRRRVDSLLAD